MVNVPYMDAMGLEMTKIFPFHHPRLSSRTELGEAGSI